MKLMHLRKTLLAATLLASTTALAITPPALARMQAVSETDTSRPQQSAGLGFMLVTSRKKEESLDDLPLSVTVFSGYDLADRGESTLDTLWLGSPNITFQNHPGFGGSGNSAAIRIRGIGATDFTPTTDPGVGLYVDGVYYARSIGAILDLVEIDRIEVLRGPQGTLFGRNTIGGAINITTMQPQDEFGTLVSATYGTDNRRDLTGTLNLPVSDTLLVRGTLGSFNQDGYVTRADGIDLGDTSTMAGRLAVHWEPHPDFTLDLSIDGTRSEENGPALSLLGVRYGPQTIDASTPPFVFFNNIAATLGGAVPNPLPPGPPPPACATAASPLNPGNPLCYDDRYVTGDSSENFGTSPAFSDLRSYGAALTADWFVSDTLTIKSVSSYRGLESEFARDGDHSPLLISAFEDDLEQTQFSQEIQFLGTAMDERLDWIFGLYYFKEDGQNVNRLDFIISDFQSGGFFDNRSKAVFAQATYDITDDWHLTAGLRWSEDERNFRPDQFIETFNPATAGFLSPAQQFIFTPGTPILPSVEASQIASDVTPLINLAYDVNRELMVYGMFSQGFKSGGFTQRVLPPLIAGITCPATPVDCIPGYDPEYVDAFELGFRYAPDHNRLRSSGAIFFTDYKDLQISTFTSVAPVVENAAAASIAGAEFEIRAQLSNDIIVNAALGYIDAGYDEIDPQTRVDVGNAFERVSEWSANLSAWRDYFVGAWIITPRADWAYRSEYFNDAFNQGQIAQDGFHVFDLSVSAISDGGMSVVLGAQNVTDERYLETGVFGDAFSSYEGVYSRGREVFLRVSYEQ